MQFGRQTGRPQDDQRAGRQLGRQTQGPKDDHESRKNRARICKHLRSPGIDSEELIPPGWESIPGLLKRFTNTGSG